MKLISVIFTAVLITSAESCFTQGFVNLNFESASLVPAGGYYVQFNQAFPGWTGTCGGVQQTLALYNEVYLDTAGIAIIDHNWTNSAAYINNFGYPPLDTLIQGNYTAILMSGLGPPTGQPADTSLSQTGLVPAGTQSLLFRAYPGFDSSGVFTVTLGGQDLSLTVISNALNYTLYGADISAWAGQTAQLSFNVLGENPHQNDEYLYLDSIQFSTQSIPEPSVFALAALGALFLGLRRQRNSSR